MQKISGTTEHWESRVLGADADYAEVADAHHQADLLAALDPVPGGHLHVKVLLQRGLDERQNLDHSQLPG